MTRAPDVVNLSVILITRDEGRNVLACLQSVAFVDEWIVVDSGSTNDTREIAAAFGATVVRTDDCPGFGAQKNHALDLARGRWVLSIDADERVSPALAIQNVSAARRTRAKLAPACLKLGTMRAKGPTDGPHEGWYGRTRAIVR